ncbi:MAG: U32 family peptidase C-terminal domain-containing protein [Anaerovoracaceae bacterium]
MLLDEKGEPLMSAPHPQQILQIKMDKPVKEHYILRKRKGE